MTQSYTEYLTEVNTLLASLGRDSVDDRYTDALLRGYDSGMSANDLVVEMAHTDACRRADRNA